MALPPGSPLCYGLRVRAAALALTLLLSACPEPPLRVGTTLDLRLPSTRPSPRIPLVPMSLATQKDFDSLEDRYIGRRDTAPLLAALDKIAGAAKPGERAEDALLLMRLAVLYRDQDQANRDEQTDRGYLQKALALGTRLRSEAPGSPHTLYLQGYIPFAYLGGSLESAMLVTPDAREFATACRDQWRQLLVHEATYDGPHTLDHGRIQGVVAALDAALAEYDKTPLVTTPAVGPVAGVVASRPEVEAMNQLTRFETSSDGDRKTQCRDWDAGRAAVKADAPRSPLELELDLACSTFLGGVDIALPLIVRLRDSGGPAFDACNALVRLRARSDPTRFELALKATDLRCP